MMLPDWEPESWVALGTIALAVMTLLLAFAATAQVRKSRQALDASLRPLLVDVPVGGPHDPFRVADDGKAEIEVTLRNGGPGLALIAAGPRLIWEDFASGWSGVAQQLVVLPRERVRLTFRQSFGKPESASKVVEAATKFAIEVDYTDVNGRQKTRTRAYVIEHPDEESTVDLFIDRIEISRRRLWRRKSTLLTGRTAA